MGRGGGTHIRLLLIGDRNLPEGAKLTFVVETGHEKTSFRVRAARGSSGHRGGKLILHVVAEEQRAVA